MITFKEFIDLSELKYPGNIGVMELAKFYKIATAEEKTQMKKLLATNKKAAWEFLQKVTGVELEPI